MRRPSPRPQIWQLLAPLLPLLFAAGCRTTATASSAKDAALPATAATGTTDDMASVLQFRDIFHKIAQQHGFQDAAIQQMLFLPRPAEVALPAAAATAQTPADAAAALLALGKNFTPSDIYQNGVATPFHDVDTDKIFANAAEPVTFIVIPGLFGEFIDANPFANVYTQASSFKTTYQASLTGLQDQEYSLNAQGPVPIALGDRVLLGGIDGADGKPRVQVILMKMQWGSLESVGAIADSAKVNLRRLQTLFKALPLAKCKNIYLIGYSRGTPEAYEMVAQAAADPANNAFIANLRGVLTLAGVNYGTELADDAFTNPNSSTYKALTGVQATLDTLTVDPNGQGFITQTGQLISSWRDIFNLAMQMAGTSGAISMPPGLSYENLNSTATDPFFLLELAYNVLDRTFAPGLSVQDNLANIQRGKLLISQIIAAAKELMTVNRTAWWQTHTLPSGLTIYSIAGSMPEVSTATGSTSMLLNNPYYGETTLDYTMTLRKGYYDLFRISQVAINDSQVVETKAHFWPQLMTLYNPAQTPLPGYYMGVVGTHHWGISFPEAFKAANGAVNPFPREVLLEAMAGFIQAPKGAAAAAN